MFCYKKAKAKYMEFEKKRLESKFCIRMF